MLVIIHLTSLSPLVSTPILPLQLFAFPRPPTATVGIPQVERAITVHLCPHETPPHGGTVRISHPKPVSLRPLSWCTDHRCPRDQASVCPSPWVPSAGPPLSGARYHIALASRSVEPPCVAPGRDAADLSGLPLAVAETIDQARAPSTRQTYALKGSLFANWCSSCREDPRRCRIGVVLSFLQESLERRLSPSTLKVYVATIAWCSGPWCSGRPVPGKAWFHREVPEWCQEDESLQVTPCALLGPLYRPSWTSEWPPWAAGLSRAEIPVG